MLIFQGVKGTNLFFFLVLEAVKLRRGCVYTPKSCLRIPGWSLRLIWIHPDSSSSAILDDSKSQTLQNTRWWFQIFFIFTPIWARFPFWLIFFKGVETTNQNKSSLGEVPFPYLFQKTPSFRSFHLRTSRGSIWLVGIHRSPIPPNLEDEFARIFSFPWWQLKYGECPHVSYSFIRVRWLFGISSINSILAGCWQLKYFLNVHPETWGTMNPFWGLHIFFQMGLVKNHQLPWKTTLENYNIIFSSNW